MTEKKTKNTGLNRIGNTVEKPTTREDLERREIYKRTTKDLFLYKLTTSSLSVTECMLWAVNTAKKFAALVVEHADDDVEPVKMSDEQIVKKVGEHGLVADVLFTNDDLVESYGYVKKSGTEF